jgi:hypothetical protein
MIEGSIHLNLINSFFVKIKRRLNMVIELVVDVVIWITIVIGILLFIAAMVDDFRNQNKLITIQRQTNDLLADILNVLEYDIGDKVPDKKLKAPVYDKVSEGYHGN